MPDERLAHSVLRVFESRAFGFIVIALAVANLWHGQVYAALGNASVWPLAFVVVRRLRRTQRAIELQRVEIEARRVETTTTLQ